MTGPLAPLFAQLEGTLNYFEAITLSLGRGERTERLAESRTALSSIERHVQDMDALVLDMGEVLRPLAGRPDALTEKIDALLSRLGAGDSNQNEKEQT